MSNLFKSYFGGGGSEANRFVGQLLDLGEGTKLKVKKVIAEGESIGIDSKLYLYSYWTVFNYSVCCTVLCLTTFVL